MIVHLRHCFVIDFLFLKIFLGFIIIVIIIIKVMVIKNLFVMITIYF